MKVRPWLEGAGLAMLYLLPLIALFLASGQNAFYHQVMPVTSLTRGVFLDLVLIAVVGGGGLAWLSSRKSQILQRVLWLPILFVTAWLTERGLSEFLRNVGSGIYVPVWAMQLHWVTLGVAVLLLFFARSAYDIAVKVGQTFLASAGIAAVFVVLPQLLYACFNHAPPEQAFFSHAVRQPWHPGEKRIVWLLFDELSYKQVFERPAPGIHLPTFAQLKQESVSFSRIVPLEKFTEKVIPSLLLGQSISDVKSNHRAELLWRSGPRAGWQHFDANDTVFAAARSRGWGTGVVGWYNPYCRLLASTVDRCYWTYREFAGGSRFSRLSSERSTLQNARDALPLAPQMIDALRHTTYGQVHKENYRSVLQHAKAMIADTDIRFAFIHLPIPHPPGIYPDPGAGGREDYLGNLILADQTLAELRGAIQATAAAPDTILVVSSDHSWRVFVWRGGPPWTKAEERASDGGQFDDRPVLMVHFPGQTEQSAESIDQPENAMILHSMLLGMIAGKISSVNDLNETLSNKELSTEAAAAQTGE